jgi:outer membrane lipoprotein-sorting protein
MNMKIKTLTLIFGLLYCITKEATALEGTQNFENYLNSLKTLSGNFIQRNSHGQTSSGKIQISRPGKMRLTYNPPSPLLIVADGKWLVTKDREADQVDYVSLENTPAAFILRPHIRFSGADMEVISVVAKGEETEVSLVRTEDPDGGHITLVFQESPLTLKEWRIVDAQGVETQVVLSNVKSNIPLPAELFNIESPNLIQQIF